MGSFPYPSFLPPVFPPFPNLVSTLLTFPYFLFFSLSSLPPSLPPCIPTVEIATDKAQHHFCVIAWIGQNLRNPLHLTRGCVL